MNIFFKEKFPALYNENAERIRMKPRHESSIAQPTVTFRGIPLRYAEDGFVNTYCKDKESD